MPYIYSDPKRADDPHAMPDIEVWEVTPDSHLTRPVILETSAMREAFGDSLRAVAPGWYWWSCFPGCLPDSDPIGPFDSEEDAIADAQDV